MDALRLKPVYVKSIWAGDRLQKIRDLEPGIGIAREVCAYRNSENEVLNPEYAGKNVKDLIDECHEELMGSDPADQLVRAAYIDAVDDLSIQVHPAQKAAEEKGDYEKSESWYILEADPRAAICAGTLTQDREVLRQAAQDGSLEDHVRMVPVVPGDFALIPAGMLHACGKNMLAIEIGSFGGITYRLYDYGRGRELHLEEGFKVLDPSLQTTVTHHPLPDRRTSNIEPGVDHPLFHVDVIDVNGRMTLPTNGHYCILVDVGKSGKVICAGKDYPLGYTETLLIPASQKEFTLEGNFRVLCGYHPTDSNQ